MAHEHDAHHHDADAEYLETPGSSYEHTDADSKSIVHFALWLAAIAVGVHFLLGFAFSAGIKLTAATSEPRYPLASVTESPMPPKPQLQQFPREDMYTLWKNDEAELTRYGWVNKEKGQVHIPIDEAIKLTLERGLPSREAGAVETPGMMPTDASAGRAVERRRQ